MDHWTRPRIFFEKLAMIGETKWQHGMAAFCRPFTKAAIKYFDRAQREMAMEWIEAE